jgi:hypothetical protein
MLGVLRKSADFVCLHILLVVMVIVSAAFYPFTIHNTKLRCTMLLLGLEKTVVVVIVLCIGNCDYSLVIIVDRV